MGWVLGAGSSAADLLLLYPRGVIKAKKSDLVLAVDCAGGISHLGLDFLNIQHVTQSNGRSQTAIDPKHPLCPLDGVVVGRKVKRMVCMPLGKT